jgi:hypothetical protein
MVCWVDGCDGGKKDPKIPIESSVRRGCLGSSHGLFFCEMVFDAHTRCGSL